MATDIMTIGLQLKFHTSLPPYLRTKQGSHNKQKTKQTDSPIHPKVVRKALHSRDLHPHPSLFLKNVLRSQETRQVAPNTRRFFLEQTVMHAQVQDGDHREDHEVNSCSNVGHIHRLDGCLSTCPSSSRVPCLLCFCPVRPSAQKIEFSCFR